MDVFKEEMNFRGVTDLGPRLSPSQVLSLKDDLVARKEHEINEFGEGELARHKDLEIMRNLIRFGGLYSKLIEEPWLNKFVDSVLDHTAVIQDMFAMITRPNINSEMTSYRFHRDQPWFKDMRTSVFVFFPLVDFTVENGATQYVPSTHTFKRIPSQGYLEKHKQHMTMPAGHAFAMDAALWHRAGYNLSTQVRPLIFLKYQLAFQKQPIDLCEANPHILETASPLLKQRMGWDCRSMASHIEYRDADRKWKPGQYEMSGSGLHYGMNIHEYQ